MEPEGSGHRRFSWKQLWGEHKHAIAFFFLGLFAGWFVWWSPNAIKCYVFVSIAPGDPDCGVLEILRSMYGLGMIWLMLSAAAPGALVGGWLDMLYSRAKEREWYEKQLKEERERQDRLREEDRKERDKNHREVIAALENLASILRRGRRRLY